MALPVGLTYITNVKGPKGDTGSLAYAEAVTVPADQPASVEMIGPLSNRGAKFSIPRGLPGLNAVPTDEAVATMLGADDTLSNASMKGALAGSFTPLSGLRKALDVWPAAYTGQTTYTAYIAEIDAAVGTVAEKVTIGTASNGTTPIHSYTAGNARGKRILLNSCTHGNEGNASAHAFQWFKAFCTSDDPVFVALRARIQVTWIPFLNASQYLGTRVNSNGVNINRNFNLNWALYEGTDKGTSAESENETLAIKAAIDSRDIECIIDVHTTVDPAATTYLAIGGETPTQHTNRNLSMSALGHAAQLYSPLGADFQQYTYSITPNLREWGAKYLRWERSKTNASSVIIELGPNLLGSNGGEGGVRPYVSKNAIRSVCGLITLFIIEWLENGQVEPQPLLLTTAARSRPGLSSTVPISAGGRRLSTDMAPFPLANGRTFMPVPIPARGLYLIEYSFALRNSGTTGVPVNARVSFGPAKRTGSNVMLEAGRVDGVIAQPNYADTVVTARGYAEVTTLTGLDSNIFMVEVFLGLAEAGGTVSVAEGYRGLCVSVTPMPRYGTLPSLSELF